MQEPQPLRGRLLGEEIDAGRVAARPSKALDQAKSHRVLTAGEYDRYRRGRRFGRERSDGSARRGDDSHATADEISHERGHALEAAVEPMVLDLHVLTLDVADFLEAFSKLSTNVHGAYRRTGANESNHRHRRLLCARRERPRGRATEQRDELAAHHHSITSSARASSEGGTSRPSAFPVLRLMSSSYLFGFCTGRSAGFSPLRMRSTYPAACRYCSIGLGP